MAWLSFTELDKAVVCVIRLARCLFQSVCPLMPSLSAYCLTWVSLTLDVGYLFTAAPAKRSHLSLPWTWVAWTWVAPLSHARHRSPSCRALAQSQLPFLFWLLDCMPLLFGSCSSLYLECSSYILLFP